MPDPQLITLSEANDHLRLDLAVVNAETSPASTTFEDDRIPGLLTKIIAAEAVVLDYLKVQGPLEASGSPPSGGWSDQDREVVRASVLLALSALYDDAPQRTIADYMGEGGAITLMLNRLRDPTLA